MLSEAQVRHWCVQIFEAFAYMHQRGYFHRDLKPENLLVRRDMIKIADFGLAREVCSQSQSPYTDYVGSRWYRAPEILLKSCEYDPAVDMWAMGAIMAEMFTFRPLFQGSSEADVIYKICSVIATPDRDSWDEGLQFAQAVRYQFPQFPGVNLSELMPLASESAIDLISSLCSWDPSKRPTAAEVLHHSFFQPCYYNIPPSLSLRPRGTLPSVVVGLGNNKDATTTLSKSNTNAASNILITPSESNAVVAAAANMGKVFDVIDQLTEMSLSRSVIRVARGSRPPGF